jgi:hypothetical protein
VACPSGTSNKTTKYFGGVCSFFRSTSKEVPATKQQFFPKVPMQWDFPVVQATKQQNISEGYIYFLRLTSKEVPARKQHFFPKVPMHWHVQVVPATKQQNISEGYVRFLVRRLKRFQQQNNNFSRRYLCSGTSQ